MESEFLKGLGKKAAAKPAGIMDKVTAGMQKLTKEGSGEATPAASAEPPQTPEGEVDHMASITEKVLGKEAAAANEEPDALESIAKKLGLGGEVTKTAEDGDLPAWQQKVNKAFAEAEK